MIAFKKFTRIEQAFDIPIGYSADSQDSTAYNKLKFISIKSFFSFSKDLVHKTDGINVAHTTEKYCISCTNFTYAQIVHIRHLVCPEDLITH